MINVFIFAKVLLIGKPLIYPVLHKCFVFTVVLICFQIAESVLVGVWRGNTVANSFPPIFGRECEGPPPVSDNRNNPRPAGE